MPVTFSPPHEARDALAPHVGSQAQALAVFHTLWQAEQCFLRACPQDTVTRETAWRLLEQAEQHIPQIDDYRLFRRAQRHADRVWRLATDGAVSVARGQPGQTEEAD